MTKFILPTEDEIFQDMEHVYLECFGYVCKPNSREYHFFKMWAQYEYLKLKTFAEAFELNTGNERIPNSRLR